MSQLAMPLTTDHTAARTTEVTAQTPAQRSERTITVRGPFSLEESALFGFGGYDRDSFDGVMRLAFTVDGDHDRAAGVAVRQDGRRLHLEIETAADPDVVAEQVGRVLSADHDGRGFEELGRRDEGIGRLQGVAPGLRPPQFYSPYEAAAWSVLSARIQQRQASLIRARLNERIGTRFIVAGQPLDAFPGPSALLAADEIPGLAAVKIQRLHRVAEAALDGRLDIHRLLAMTPEEALADVQKLPGIGPFYATLIVMRSCGLVDVLPLNEPRARRAIHELYQLDHELSDAELTRFAERWAPYRMWATVLIRAASGRL